MPDQRIAAVILSMGFDELTATVVEGRHAHRVPLGSSLDVVEPVTLLREELNHITRAAGGGLPQLRAFTEDWGRALLAPALLSNPPDILILIPQGVLHDLPFHAVLTDDGTPLGCRSGISYASSASLFVRCCDRGRAARTRPAGDTPVRGGGTDVYAEAGDQAFAELAQAVAARIEGGSLGQQPFGFTRSALKSWAVEDEPPNVLCAVAHGYIDAEHYALSGLLVDPDPGVSNRARRIYDRYYSFRDLPLRSAPASEPLARPAEVLTELELELEPALPVELALLLACSAGAGVLVEGDQPASLAESLLRAGCASVIAPMWASHIDYVRTWILRFIDAWIDERRPKAIAAREAYRALPDAADVPDRLGPLHLRGDWR
jgi:CHAT domain-containing protein